MAVYNEFPVKGQLIDGDLVYLGIHTKTLNDVEANTFRYVTYEAKKNRIISHGGNVNPNTGELTFTDDNKPELIIWTYQKGPNSTATFSTKITGQEKWLYTTKPGFFESYSTSFLSDQKMFYNTQGLPDLWAGYFGYLIVEGSSYLSADIEDLSPKHYHSKFVVVIPTKLYDKSNGCIAVENSSGQGLSIPIENYTNNIPNTNIYWSSENSCKSTIPINYCQNQNIIYSGGAYSDVHNPKLYCGNALDNITKSCMGTCEFFEGKNNTPVCYPGTVAKCTTYNPKTNIYNTSEEENNNGGTGGSGENGGGGGTNGSDGGSSSSWWIILLIVGAVLIVLIIIIVIIVVLVKKSKKKESTPIPTQPVPYLPKPAPYPLQPPPNPYQPLYPSYNQPVINSPYQAIQPLP